MICLNKSLEDHWNKVESSQTGLLCLKHLWVCDVRGGKLSQHTAICFAELPLIPSLGLHLPLQLGSLFANGLSGLCSWQPPPMCCSDVLALPIFKQEEPQLSPENDARLPPLQYVLCAATSPAVKLHEETLTYLNQGSGQRTGLGQNPGSGETT